MAAAVGRVGVWVAEASGVATAALAVVAVENTGAEIVAAGKAVVMAAVAGVWAGSASTVAEAVTMASGGRAEARAGTEAV